MVKCKDCVFSYQEDHDSDIIEYDDLFEPISYKPIYEDEFLNCLCPKIMKENCYDYAWNGFTEKEVPRDVAIVEYDEGWGIWVGPEFGCIHGKLKE